MKISWPDEKGIQQLSLGLIIGLAFILLTGVLLWKPVPMGETDDYMLATVSLQYRGDLAVRPVDLESAMRDFPEFAPYLKEQYDAGRLSEYVDTDGGRLPWYFGTYSAVCIPAKIFLSALGLPQIYAFALTNTLVFLGALLTIYFSLKRKAVEKLVVLLLIGINPAVFYLVWQSAEVFLFSCVVVSLVFLANRSYARSAFFLSLAGSLNLTVMGLGFLILFLYWLDQEGTRKTQKNGFIEYYVGNYRSIALLILAFLPCLVPPLFYFFKVGVFNLQVSYGFADFAGTFGRALAYLFDLNLGIFPYMPAVMLVYAVLVVLNLVIRKPICLYYGLALLVVVGSYSIMFHINSGMSGIARYNVWVTPILIFGVLEGLSEIRGRAIRLGLFGLLSAGTAFSLGVILTYGFMFAKYTSDIRLTPIAEWFLDSVPALYEPYPATFIDRVAHIAGGYNYKDPVIYQRKDGVVTKILTNSEVPLSVTESFSGDAERLQRLSTEYLAANQTPGYHYLTLDPSDQITVRANYVLEKTFQTKDGVVPLSRLALRAPGVLKDEKILLPPTGLQFGPYVDLPKADYRLRIRGENLNLLRTVLTANAGNAQIPMAVEAASSTEMILHFTTNSVYRRVEIINENTSLEPVTIAEVYLYAAE